MTGVGEDAHHIDPFIHDGKGARTSAYFLSVNRDEKSAALDLKDCEDQAEFAI